MNQEREDKRKKEERKKQQQRTEISNMATPRPPPRPTPPSSQHTPTLSCPPFHPPGGSSSSSLMGVEALEVQGGRSGRLARVLRSVPASALSSGQWARRGNSSSSNTPRPSTSHSTYFQASSSTFHLQGRSSSDSITPMECQITPSPAMLPPLAPPAGGGSGGSTMVFTSGGHKFDSGLEGTRGSTSRKRRAQDTLPKPFELSSTPSVSSAGREDLEGRGESSSRADPTDEEVEQVVMSLSWSQGKLGAAFYHVSTGQVYMVEDKIEAAPDFWVLKTLFREQRPRWVLIGGRQDERLFSVLRELCNVPETPLQSTAHQSGGGSADQPRSGDRGSSTPSTASPSASPSTSLASAACNMRVLPMVDFKYELCIRRVLSLSLPGEPEGLSESEREIFVRGRINTDLVSMTRALGALLRFLDKHGAELLAGTTLLGGTPVLGVHYYSITELAHLDDATVMSLQIFSEDQHPSAFKSGKTSSSKEGLSIYALLSRTSSPMAAHTLRSLLLRPVVDTEVLEARYAAVEWGVEAANLETVRHLQACLKNISNVPHTMRRLQRGQLNVRDWRTLYKSLFNAILVGEICQGQDQDIPIFKEVSDSVTEGLYHATFLIQRIMDMDQSEREARFVVKPGVDTDLDDKKRRFSGLGDVMRRVAEVELERLPPEVESCCIIYLPHVGYLLAFSSTPELDLSLNAQGYQMPGLEFMFRTNDMILYKSETCHELDRELGDIQVDIANHETRIMMRLVETLLLQASTFMHLVQEILRLDCLLSFSVVSRECGWVRPCLTQDPQLVFEEARHPLYELCTPTFVANAVRSGNPGPSITIITGPNASGKTVYLKQIGVLAVLAQVGCWVPASRAQLKPFDAIVAVTQSTPPVMSNLSAFMLDLTRMCTALHRATRNSLVIIDEFGTATYENDGAALLTACLDHWAERSVRPSVGETPSGRRGLSEGERSGGRESGERSSCPSVGETPSGLSESERSRGRESGTLSTSGRTPVSRTNSGEAEGSSGAMSPPRGGRGGPRLGNDPLGAPPHVFVSTHLLQVYDHLQHPEAVRCLVLEAVEEDGTVVPLYQVSEGRAKKSYASVVAALAGVPQHVVDRANKICECIRSGQLPARWSYLEEDEDEKRQCEEIVSLVLSHDLASDSISSLLEKIRNLGGPKTPLNRTRSSRDEGSSRRSSSSFSFDPDVTPKLGCVETVLVTDLSTSTSSINRDVEQEEQDRREKSGPHASPSIENRENESNTNSDQLEKESVSTDASTVEFALAPLTSQGEHLSEIPERRNSLTSVAAKRNDTLKLETQQRKTPSVQNTSQGKTPSEQNRTEGTPSQQNMTQRKSSSAQNTPQGKTLSEHNTLQKTSADLPQRKDLSAQDTPQGMTAPNPPQGKTPLGQNRTEGTPSQQSMAQRMTPSVQSTPQGKTLSEQNTTQRTPSDQNLSQRKTPSAQGTPQRKTPSEQSRSQGTPSDRNVPQTKTPSTQNTPQRKTTPDPPLAKTPFEQNRTERTPSQQNMTQRKTPSEQSTPQRKATQDPPPTKTPNQNTAQDNNLEDKQKEEKSFDKSKATPGSAVSSLLFHTTYDSSQDSHEADTSSTSSCGRESVVIKRRYLRNPIILSQEGTQSFQVSSHAFQAFLGSSSSKP